MHHMPPLPHDFREGVPGLLSAEGFDMAWTQHMTLMLDKLNAMTAGRFLGLLNCLCRVLDMKWLHLDLIVHAIHARDNR